MTFIVFINALAVVSFGLVGICAFVGVCIGATHQIAIAALALLVAYVFYVEDSCGISVERYLRVLRRARSMKKKM